MAQKADGLSSRTVVLYEVLAHGCRHPSAASAFWAEAEPMMGNAIAVRNAILRERMADELLFG
jgi:hypothetical protein